MEHKEQQSYGLLLILMDGALLDVGLTQQALHNASDAPFLIVIFSFGIADFDHMQFLDDFANSDPNQHGIVQFVEFNKFADDKNALVIGDVFMSSHMEPH